MTERAYLLAWLKAFLFTLAVELPIASALFRKAEPRLARRLALAFFANLGSHPAVWLIFPAIGLSYETTVTISEAWAFGIEAIFFAVVFEKSGPLHAAAVSALANGASYGLGLLVRHFTGWV
ncbi:MAG: hypothetical protein U0359_03955 [Byssovorax sp.]